jgi:LAS superfamily LD-carboxypeptidase LdcB
MTFSNNDRQLLNQFVELSISNSLNGLSSMDDLWKCTTIKSKKIIKNIISLDPKIYGFKGELIPSENNYSNILTVDKTEQGHNGEYAIDKESYMPEIIYEAFNNMANEFKIDYPKRSLLIGSCYRSPAFQIFTLIYILVKIYSFNLAKTLKRVALPNYSQHCSFSSTAVDIINVDGEPTDENPEKFSNSIEYKWLVKNAINYNFYESYPPDNKDGIMWEPWHWQYLKATS